MKHFPLLCVAVFFTVASCQCGRGEAAFSNAGTTVPDTLKYAEYLHIEKSDSFVTVEVRDPWKVGNILQRYLLIPRGTCRDDVHFQGTVIEIPVRNIVVFSGVHASIMEELGCISMIRGVCETDYIISPAIREMVRDGAITDLGSSYSPDVEKLIALGPDVIIASTFENYRYGAVEKLGIPIVEGADYMENRPLGRTEWIKFFALLVGKTELGDSIFYETEGRYESIRENVARSRETRPSVIAERKYGGSWGIAGRDSYMATLYRDAGAEYLFDDIPGTGSVKMQFEKVLEMGINADFWLIKYASERPFSYDDLLEECPQYSEFDTFKRHGVFGCNTLLTPYYRDITLHPDLILEDLVRIFHPGLAEGEHLYFKPLR